MKHGEMTRQATKRFPAERSDPSVSAEAKGNLRGFEGEEFAQPYAQSPALLTDQQCFSFVILSYL